MNATITVSIPRKMKTQLDRIAKRENVKKADIVRGALGRYIARMELDVIREVTVPAAQKKAFSRMRMYSSPSHENIHRF